MIHVSRYHPLLVTLHWLLAFLIIAALASGSYWLAATPNTDPQKIAVLRLHMAGGMLILVLMVIRFIVRMWTSRPTPGTTGSRLRDRITPISHYGFYLLVLAMAGTGFATALLAGLPAIVFGGSGDPLPSTFMVYPTRVVHGVIALLLAGLIIWHVLTAFYRQFVGKGAPFRRMSFGRRVSNQSAAPE